MIYVTKNDCFSLMITREGQSILMIYVTKNDCFSLMITREGQSITITVNRALFEKRVQYKYK
jgi:hypothetical protein